MLKTSTSGGQIYKTKHRILSKNGQKFDGQDMHPLGIVLIHDSVPALLPQWTTAHGLFDAQGRDILSLILLSIFLELANWDRDDDFG